ALFLELLDIGFAHARRDVPVDRAHFVARLVLAHFRELEARSAKGRSISAGERGVDELVRADLDLLHARHQLRREHARPLRGPGVTRVDSSGHGPRVDQGTGTVSSTRATRASESSPS